MQAAISDPSLSLLEELRSLVAADWATVNGLIGDALASNVALIGQVAGHITGSGGKRLRPLNVLLAARACGYQGDQHVHAAVVIEFIHTATLLHDDVVDDSHLRRGRQTANELWGNPASVLVGDFLYSRAFQLMVAMGELRIMDILADATNSIAEGEVLQLLHVGDADTSEASYREVIYRKTARLFEAGNRIAAVLAGLDEEGEHALARFGKHLGIAFQLVDDALDYAADSGELGKNVGDDLAEGKPTLPLIYAMQHGNPQQQRIVREALQQGGLAHLQEIRATIEATGALEYTFALARTEADKAEHALSVLPDSSYKDALASLTALAVSRRH